MDFTSLSLISFFCCRPHSGYHTILSDHVFLSFSGDSFSDLIFDDLNSFEEYWSVILFILASSLPTPTPCFCPISLSNSEKPGSYQPPYVQVLVHSQYTCVAVSELLTHTPTRNNFTNQSTVFMCTFIFSFTTSSQSILLQSYSNQASVSPFLQ